MSFSELWTSKNYFKRLFKANTTPTPPPLQKNSTDLDELQRPSQRSRAEQLLHLLQCGYATASRSNSLPKLSEDLFFSQTSFLKFAYSFRTIFSFFFSQTQFRNCLNSSTFPPI